MLRPLRAHLLEMSHCSAPASEGTCNEAGVEGRLPKGWRLETRRTRGCVTPHRRPGQMLSASHPKLYG